MIIDTRLMLVLVMVFGISVSCAAVTTVPCDNPNFGLSPYTWKCTGSGASARAEATFPGAYFKTVVNGTATIGVVIDGTGNTGCPASSMPYVEYSVDDGPFTASELTQTGAVYTFPVATGLNAAASHKLEFYFRAADLGQNRWTASTAHLRIVGVSVDNGGSLTAFPMRSKRAIGFGDSITEGFAVDAPVVAGPNWMSPCNARCTWLHFVSSALDCEYGQFGSCGQGMVNTALTMPPLPQTWDHYDSTTSRLRNGLLLPEPDYVLNNMGNNDGILSITSDYTAWLQAVRAACPHARIFCIVPPAGVHRGEIQAAVTALNQAGDAKVYFINLPLVIPLAPNLGKPSQGSYDGGHPTQYGQGMFGSAITAKVQDILSKERLK